MPMPIVFPEDFKKYFSSYWSRVSVQPLSGLTSAHYTPELNYSLPVACLPEDVQHELAQKPQYAFAVRAEAPVKPGEEGYSVYIQQRRDWTRYLLSKQHYVCENVFLSGEKVFGLSILQQIDAVCQRFKVDKPIVFLDADLLSSAELIEQFDQQVRRDNQVVVLSSKSEDQPIVDKLFAQGISSVCTRGLCSHADIVDYMMSQTHQVARLITRDDKQREAASVVNIPASESLDTYGGVLSRMPTPVMEGDQAEFDGSEFLNAAKIDDLVGDVDRYCLQLSLLNIASEKPRRDYSTLLGSQVRAYNLLVDKCGMQHQAYTAFDNISSERISRLSNLSTQSQMETLFDSLNDKIAADQKVVFFDVDGTIIIKDGTAEQKINGGSVDNWRDLISQLHSQNVLCVLLTTGSPVRTETETFNVVKSLPWDGRVYLDGVLAKSQAIREFYDKCLGAGKKIDPAFLDDNDNEMGGLCESLGIKGLPIHGLSDGDYEAFKSTRAISGVLRFSQPAASLASSCVPMLWGGGSGGSVDMRSLAEHMAKVGISL